MSAQGSGGPAQERVREPVEGASWAPAWLAVLLAALFAVSLYSYPVFHTLAELFCMIVAASIFIFVLHTRRLLDNHYLLFVGLGLLFFILLGIPHLLGYSGVDLLPGFDNDLPTQAFIAQRFALALTFLLAPLFLSRRLRIVPVLSAFAVATALLLLSMLVWRNFPHMFIDGTGLTPLKRESELAISALFLAAGAILVLRRRAFDPKVLRILVAALACFTLSELLFMTYATPYGPSNLVGHLLQVAAFYFTYRAVLVTALVNPYTILFRELSASGAENARLFQAESLRAERMSLLKDVSDVGAAPLGVHETASRLIEILELRLKPATALMLTLGPDAKTLEPLAGFGYDEGFIEQRFGPIDVEGPGTSAVVFRSQRAAVIRDTESDPTLTDPAREFNRAIGVRSGVSLPIMAKEETIGVLSIGFPEPRTFDEAELSFFESLASQFALDLQSAQYVETETANRLREAERARRLAALADLAERASSSLDIDQVAQNIVAEVQRLFEAQQVQVRLASADGKMLEPVATVDTLGGYLRDMGPMAIDADTETSACFRSATGRIGEDVEAGSVRAGSRVHVEKTGVRSYVLLPLLARGEAIGTFFVGWTEPQIFTAESISFFEAAAAQFVAGLQNARLFKAEREARALASEELETTRLLLDAAKSLSSTLAIGEVLERFAAAALEITGLSRAFVNLIDMGNQVLTPVIATAGLVSPSSASIPFDQLSDTSRAAILAKRTAILDFERPDTAERDKEIAGANQVRRALFVPLLVAGEVVGEITMDEKGQRHKFSSREVELLETISAQAALVVRNARLFEAAQHHAGLDRAIAECAAMLSEALDADAVMPQVIDLAASAVGAMGGLVVVRGSAGWRVMSARGLPDDFAGTIHTDSRATTLGRIAEAKAPHFVADVSHEEPIVREAAERMGYRAFVTIPALYRDRVGAALSLLFAQPRGPLSDEEMYTLTRIAFMIGVTQENARLYQREHTIAETLQEALLALPETMPGIELAHAYRSATEGSRVGGDFYDVFELSPNRLGVTIGDVAGKGLNAAVVTSLVKNTIRAHATELGKSPARVIGLTDDVVFKATPTETFVTVFFGVLDLEVGSLTYANAGHTASAVVRANGSVTKLGVTGPLLGAFPNARFEEDQVAIDRGDLLFLYTDGLTEARRERELYGEERLMSLLSAEAGKAPEDVLDAVMDAVMEYSDNHLRDDLAILAIRPTEGAADAG